MPCPYPKLDCRETAREHPEFANISVGAKHDRSKSLILTNNLSAVMLRPYKFGMLPTAMQFPLYYSGATTIDLIRGVSDVFSE